MSVDWTLTSQEAHPYLTGDYYEATIKGDGYQVRSYGSRWVASVRCARIGQEYDTREQAMQACARTAGIGETAHTWQPR